MALPEQIRVRRRSSDRTNLEQATRMTTAVVPLGPIRSADLCYTESVIAQHLGTKVTRVPEMALPHSYYDGWHSQWIADGILNCLFDRLRRLPMAVHRIIGVLDADMYAGNRTFVFGFANLQNGVSVISLARLREEWYGRRPNTELFRSRIFRAVAHELGHTFGNDHCEDHDGCVMRSVSQIESLDALNPRYCQTCSTMVQRGLSIQPTSAEGYFLRAGALRRQRYFLDAINCYLQAVERVPTEARYWNDLGVAYLAVGDQGRAKEMLTRACASENTVPDSFYNLGIIECDDPSAAERYFLEGLRRDPDQLRASQYLGNVYDKLFNNPEGALRHYQRYIDLGGSDPETWSRAWAMRALLQSSLPNKVAAAGHTE